jgi:hypothetical protein
MPTKALKSEAPVNQEPMALWRDFSAEKPQSAIRDAERAGTLRMPTVDSALRGRRVRAHPGSGLTLNCLRDGGARRPITLNRLHWRQDMLGRRLSFYVGKIHPNEYIAPSMFNDHDTSQFLNRARSFVD